MKKNHCSVTGASGTTTQRPSVTARAGAGTSTCGSAAGEIVVARSRSAGGGSIIDGDEIVDGSDILVGGGSTVVGGCTACGGGNINSVSGITDSDGDGGGGADDDF